MSEDLYQAIGGALAEGRGESESAALLHFASTDGVYAPAIFRALGNFIEMERVPDALSERIFDAWNDLPPENRWSGMYFLLEGQDFRVEYVYPDQLDFRAVEDARTETVARLLGTMPIRYPQIPGMEPWEG